MPLQSPLESPHPIKLVTPPSPSFSDSLSFLSQSCSLRGSQREEDLSHEELAGICARSWAHLVGFKLCSGVRTIESLDATVSPRDSSSGHYLPLDAWGPRSPESERFPPWLAFRSIWTRSPYPKARHGAGTVVFIHGLVMDNLSSWYFTAANPVAENASVLLMTPYAAC